jgi:hypothetical protein
MPSELDIKLRQEIVKKVYEICPDAKPPIDVFLTYGNTILAVYKSSNGETSAQFNAYGELLNKPGS